MLYGPSPFMELPRNPFSVAFPRQLFGTYNDRGLLPGDRLDRIDPFPEIIGSQIRNISALSEAAEFPAEEVIFDAVRYKKRFKIVSMKERKFAVRKTPDVEKRLYAVPEEYLDEILPAPAVGSESKDYLVAHLLMIALNEARDDICDYSASLHSFKNQANYSDKKCRHGKIFPLTEGRFIDEN
jgi:hypothetical protein